jgi:transcriptional regulator with PAS, ATPase and Fis domain
MAEGHSAVPQTLPTPAHPDYSLIKASHTPNDSAMHVIHPSHDGQPEEEDVFQDSVVVEDEPLALEEREKKAIRLALERHGGKRTAAAKELHISERTLYRKIKEYDITI